MISGVWGWGREQQREENDRGDTAKPFLSAGLAPSSSILCCSPAVLHVNLVFTSKCFAHPGMRTPLVSPELVLPGEWGVMREKCLPPSRLWAHPYPQGTMPY